MASDEHGRVDFGPEGFVARFDYHPAIVAVMQGIQRRRWLQPQRAWIVEPHWPSVRRLLHIASDRGWEISAEARAAESRIRADSEWLEYSLDVVHDSHGAAWFQCKVGDDDVLMRQIRELPGAYWDDGWWIPSDWEQCCGPLRELALSDTRIEVSSAAWRLLEEADVSDLYVRSTVPGPFGPLDSEHASDHELAVSPGAIVVPLHANPTSETR